MVYTDRLLSVGHQMTSSLVTKLIDIINLAHASVACKFRISDQATY